MPHALQFEILRTWEAAEAARGEWEDLYARSGAGQVFSSHAWCRAWWHTLGAAMEPRIVLIRQQGILVALAPLVIAPRRSGPFHFRVLHFIGAPQADYCDLLLAEPDAALFEAVLEAIGALAADCHFVALEHLQDRGPNWPLWRDLASSGGLRWSLGKPSKALSLDLGGLDFEAFQRALPKGVRYDLRRYEKDLAAQGSLTLQVIPATEAPTHFERLWAFLDEREAATGRNPDRDSRQRFEALFTALLADPETCAHFSALEVGGAPISYHFGFMDGAKFYYYKPAFAPEYARSSPGKILLARLVRLAIEADLTEFDFLGGEEDYKTKWANGSRQVVDLTGFHQSLYRRFPEVWLCYLKPRLVRLREIILSRRAPTRTLG